MTEKRVVDPDTGGMKGQKLAQAHAMPASVLLELAEHYGKGIAKYPDAEGGVPNYTRGYAWSLSYDAAMRHLLQFWEGEDVDPETGTKHVIAAAWHCLALALFMDTHREKDDRWEEQTPLHSVQWAVGATDEEIEKWQRALDENIAYRRPSGIRRR